MAVYRQAPMERYLTPFIFTLFAVVAVVLLVAMVRGDGPPAWFGVLWLAALGWNAYWWLLRICTEVEVDSDTLRWRAPLRRGSAPMSAVRVVRPFLLDSRTARIELDGAPTLYVPVRYGFAGLIADLRAAAPHADIRLA